MNKQIREKRNSAVKKTNHFFTAIFMAVLAVNVSGQEIHTAANAASVVNEADAVTGWTANNSALANLFSDSTDPFQGSFSLRIESTVGNGRYVALPFTAVIGEVYTITVWARRGTQVFDPPSTAFANWRGFDDFVAVPIESEFWTPYVFNVRANSTTPQIRVYTGTAESAESAGNTIFIDALSIIPAETEPPAAITNLLASNVAETSLDLTWGAVTDNVGVTNYEIFQDGVSIGNSGINTSFSVTGLTPGATYSFTVIAQDAALNTSEQSNLVNVTTPLDLIPPSAVTDLSAVVSGGEVTLSWSAATDNIGVADYEIFQNGQSIGISENALTFNVSGLEALVDYIFTIVTLDAAGNRSASSNEVNVNIFTDIIPPSAISDLSATNTTATGTQLSWSAATDNVGVTNYQVFRNGVIIANTGALTGFSDSGLLPETNYSYTVFAEDEAGNISEVSNSVQITTNSQIHANANAASLENEANSTLGWAGDGVLTSVNSDVFDGNFAIQIQSSTTVRYASYTFSAAIGATYSIRIWAKLGSMVSNPSSAALANWRGFTGFSPVNITSTEWTPYDFILTASTANPEIRIYTGDNSTNGTAGNTVFIDAVSITLPESEAPSSVSDLSASNLTATSVQLNWTASTDNVGVTNYEVFQNGQSIANTGTLTSLNITGLLPGTAYNFSVIAEDAAGNTSAPGNSVQLNTPSEIHAEINAVSIQNEANSTTGWTGEATLTSVSTNPWDGDFAMQIESTTTGQFASYSFNAVIGTIYYVRIWARQGTMLSNPPSSAFANWQGFTGFSPQTISGTDWAPYEFFVTADSENPEIRVYTGDLSTEGIVGNTVFIDAVTIGLPESEAPTAVNDLSASETSATSTYLAWSPATDNVAVTDYEIFQDGVSIGNSGTSTNFLATGLLPGGTFNFTVRASDAAGNVSLASNIVQVTTPLEVHEEANAVSIDNETNSTAGWSGAAILTSVSTNPAVGNFAMQIESTTTGQFGSYSFDATVGVLYTIRITARQGTMVSNPPSSAFANWQGFEGFSPVPIDGSDWTSYVFYLRPTVVRPEIRVYTGELAVAGTVGNTVFIDGVSIQPAETIPPATVTDLTASNTTAVGTVLSWSPTTDNVGVINYEIFRDGVSIGNSGTATTFAVTGLVPDNTYNFTVIAEDAAGNLSASSNVAQVITSGEIHSEANAASVVNEANATNGWIGAATLTSISSDVIDGNFALQIESTLTGQYTSYFFPAVVGVKYAVRIWAKQGSMVSDPPSAAIANWQNFDDFSRVSITSTEWTAYDFYVTPNTTNPEIRIYTGSLATAGVTGNTVLIDGVSITAAETEAPSAIMDLVASNTTDVSTTLSWSAATDNIGVTGYEIFQDGISIGNSGTATTFSVTGLTNGTSYTFTVVAQDAVGNSSEPGNDLVVTTIDSEAPTSITDLSASSTTDTGTLLTWSASTDNVGVTNYEVFQDAISIGNAGTELTFTVSGLTSGNTYTFTVVAQDAAGNQSEVSNTLELLAINDSIAPDAVTDLSASNTTASGTDLSWTAVLDNIGVTNYEIYIDGTLFGDSGTATEFTVSGLAPETTYSITVLSVDGAGNKSVEGNTITIITLPDTTAPSAIQDLSATNTTDVSTVLVWSAAIDDVEAIEYEIFQDEVSIGNSGSELTFNVTGLTTATTYTFTVFSLDAYGNRSEVSNVLELTTLDSEAPSAVTDLVATNITENTADLSWSPTFDNVGVTNYVIFQDGISIGNSGIELSFNVTGLTARSTYEFTVVAQDAAGNSSLASNSVFVTATSDEVPPDAVTDLTVTSTTSSTATLAWSTPLDNVGVTDYQIFQDGVRIGNTGAANTFTVTGLVPQTGYSFLLIALDGSGNPSTLSNTVIAITLADTTPPAAVTDLSASSITANELVLNWSAAIDDVGAIDYEIFQNGISIGNSGLDLTFNVTGLITATTYSFTVIAEDANGNRSPESNPIVVVTLDNLAPSNVSDLAASNTTDSSTELSWSEVSDNVGVTNYEIFQDGISIGNSETLTSFLITGLLPETTYEFYVLAQDSAQNSSAIGNIVSVTTLTDQQAPSTISDLQVLNVTEKSATLIWSAASDNVGILNYEVFQGDVSLGFTDSLGFELIDLSPETSYSFFVTAIDLAGNASALSNSVIFITLSDTEAPSAIEDLAVSNLTDTTLDLSWSEASDNIGVVNYAVLQDGILIGNSGTDLNFTVSGLTSANTYEFAVIAEDSKGNQSDSSNLLIVTTLDTEAPTAVTGLIASNTTDSGTVLSWNASTDNLGVTGYEIYQDGELLGSVDNITDFTVTDLTSLTSYIFSLIAVDAAGNTSEAVTVEITTLDGEAPILNSNLIASEILATAIVLSWEPATDNVGVINYEIFQDGIKVGNSGVANSYTLTGLSEATTYSYYIVALDLAGNRSEQSNTLNVSTLDITVPTRITELSAQNITANSLDLSWTASTDNVGVSEYEIFQDGVSIGTSETVLSFSVSDLVSATSYSFTVVARDSSGNVSLPSNALLVTTLDNIPPTGVLDLEASGVTDTGVELFWSASLDNVQVVNYEIFQDDLSIGKSGNQPNFSVKGLSSGNTYVFRVVALDAAGNRSELNNELVVTTVDTVAPLAVSDLEALTLSPTEVILTWSASIDNVGVIEYEILNNGISIGNSGSNITYTVTGLIPGTQYIFTVLAKDQAGNVSQESNQVIVTPIDDEAPQAISDLTASNTTFNSTELSWSEATDNVGIQEYEIFQDDISIGISDTGTDFNVVGLIPETSYSFYVVARDASGNVSESSNVVTITTLPIPDSDGDGVNDLLDQCPDTPQGSIVNVNGCPIFNLPSDNFNVWVTSATCTDSPTGIITISAEDNSYIYLVSVSDQESKLLNAANNFRVEILGLRAGSYEVCISIEGIESYQQCFTVRVDEPEPLEASSFVNFNDKTVSLSMSGSKEYTVSVNGKSRVTESSEITLDLEPGMNYIEVRTELECQGTYFEQIFVSEDLQVYPNPTRDWAQVYVGGTEKVVSMTLVDLNGNVLQSGSMEVPATREVALDLSQYPVGVYVIQFTGKTVNTSLKVIKQ